MRIQEINCQSILTRSGIEAVDYALNPYVGCAHGCVYCYAVFMKRFTGHTEEWGSFVDVRINAPDVLAKQLRGARPGTVLLSSVTDPYQPLEQRYGITRACLEALVHHTGFQVSILTKSALVARDLDLFCRLPGIEVGFTITTLDEEVRRRFEPHASTVRARLEALARLSEAGVATYIFAGPLLPSLSDDVEHLNGLFRKAKEAGGRRVLVDSLNLRNAASWGRVRAVLARHYPDLVENYRQLAMDRRPYHSALMAKARRLAENHGLAFEAA